MASELVQSSDICGKRIRQVLKYFSVCTLASPHNEQLFRVLGWLVSSGSPDEGMMGATLEIQRTQQMEALEAQMIRAQTRQVLIQLKKPFIQLKKFVQKLVKVEMKSPGHLFPKYLFCRTHRQTFPELNFPFSVKLAVFAQNWSQRSPFLESRTYRVIFGLCLNAPPPFLPKLTAHPKNRTVWSCSTGATGKTELLLSIESWNYNLIGVRWMKFG